MFETFEEFESQIKNLSSPYPIRKRISHCFSQPETQMFRAELKKGDLYRLIRLRSPSSPGTTNVIEETAHALRHYANDAVTPQIRYADRTRIVLEWIKGDVLSSLALDEKDYHRLGEFVPSGFRCLERASVSSSDKGLEPLLNKLGYSKAMGQVSNSLINSLGAINQLTPASEITGYCFGDTVNKNFLRNDTGNYFYVDVMGIYRKSIGSVFAKQLCMIPTRSRRAFFEGYLATFEKLEQSQGFSLTQSLPFYFTEYVASKLVKGRRTRRFSWRKRTQIAERIVIALSCLQGRDCDVVDWILDECETMI